MIMTTPAPEERDVETCADCGKPVTMGQGSYYSRAPHEDIGRVYHSACGDPVGLKALRAENASLKAEIDRLRSKATHVPEVEKAARAFLDMFVSEDGNGEGSLTLDDIDPNDLANAWDALNTALSASPLPPVTEAGWMLDEVDEMLVSLVHERGVMGISTDDPVVAQFCDDRNGRDDTVNRCVARGHIKQVGDSDTDNFSLVPWWWPYNDAEQARRLKPELEPKAASPSPPAVGAGTTKEDWWDAAALAISEDVLGRRYENIDALPVSEAETLFGIVASVEAAMINAGAQPGNVPDAALSAAVEAAVKEEREKLSIAVEALTRIERCARVNFGRQTEKLGDIAPMAVEALDAIRSGHGGGDVG